MSDYDIGIASDLARDAQHRALVDAGVLVRCPVCEFSTDADFPDSEWLECTNPQHPQPCIELCACGHHYSGKVEEAEK